MIIGKYKFKQPIALAPMEDVTDLAFRTISKKHGADILYTEFASAEALVRKAKKTVEKVRVLEEERPIAIQIFGSKEDAIHRSIEVVEELKPDFIDINCGCWVKKVVNRGEGAGLLRDLEKFKSVISTAVKATKLPVTVKTRLGWDADNIVILKAAKIVEDCGAKALTVHCRTREQGYKGLADWSWLEKIKNEISIPLIGNGDIKQPADAVKMFNSGCDGVMIGRGAIGNPWIFSQCKYLLKHKSLPPEPAVKERIELCIEHLNLCYKYKKMRGLFLFRQFYSHYLKGLPHVSVLRKELVQIEDIDKIVSILQSVEM
ncbi:MAG: hypothetical protein ACD_79C00655G0003 [uncultured bacterium]|nr:MAG: hypothetical protein ACD_79C00655G0003 [uncultured bacterium]